MRQKSDKKNPTDSLLQKQRTMTFSYKLKCWFKRKINWNGNRSHSFSFSLIFVIEWPQTLLDTVAVCNRGCSLHFPPGWSVLYTPPAALCLLTCLSAPISSCRVAGRGSWLEEGGSGKDFWVDEQCRYTWECTRSCSKWEYWDSAITGLNYRATGFHLGGLQNGK